MSATTESRWDRLPRELQDAVIEAAGPLTQWTTGRLDSETLAGRRGLGAAVWADAVASEWAGDLALLPWCGVPPDAFWPLRSRPLFERIRTLGRGALAEGLRHAAARNGWADGIGTSKPDKVAALAAAAGALPLLQSVGRVDGRVAANAVRFGHVPVLQWIHGRGESSLLPACAIDVAASCGRLEAVEWLHRTGVGGCSPQALLGALLGGHLAVADFLHTHRTEGCDAGAMDVVAEAGSLAAVAWLHRNRPGSCSAAAMGRALARGHDHVARWLHTHCSGGCTAAVVGDAVLRMSLEQIQWLHRHRPEFDAADALERARSVEVVAFPRRLSASAGLVVAAARAPTSRVLALVLARRPDLFTPDAICDAISAVEDLRCVFNLVWFSRTFPDILASHPIAYAPGSGKDDRDCEAVAGVPRLLLRRCRRAVLDVYEDLKGHYPMALHCWLADNFELNDSIQRGGDRFWDDENSLCDSASDSDGSCGSDG
ncbi:hypothetical protein HK105_207557 [Polyrhizophydium stewartii]|uniref:Ankyrin repeat protein n=1 Tax=Polyrhizophydium stewartii TaxID=2732419 RepID=A0ABR4N0D8_9FUNG